MKTKLYVGCKGNKRELFRSKTTPTPDSHGHIYGMSIGPFRTKTGAEFMRDHGNNNPHCRCVADAERLGNYAKTHNGFLPDGSKVITHN